MAARIEDYALIGDCESAALVARDGSIDWLCLPRFDSPACFAGLLGTPEHGRWQIAPAHEVRSVRRHYRPGTLVLETEFETEAGTVALIDCMLGRWYRNAYEDDNLFLTMARRPGLLEATWGFIRYIYGGGSSVEPELFELVRVKLAWNNQCVH